MCLSIFTFLLLLTTISLKVESRLETVIVIHRHGDRTPTSSFPNDPYSDDSYWEDGWGQLTKQGKRRMFSVGEYLRERYDGFLTNNPREVEAQSSEKPRVVESLLSILAGLYPPKGRWIWNKDLSWQPIAIAVREAKVDGFLTASTCPNLNNEMSRIYNSTEMKQLVNKHERLVKQVEQYAGVSTPHDAKEAMSGMRIQRQLGHPQPDWFTDDVEDEMKDFHGHFFDLESKTKTTQKLKAGLIFKEIITILNKKKDIYKNKKIFFLSTHDTKLAAILNALQVFNKLPPPFGSAMLIELHSASNSHFVKSFYLNETYSEKPVPLSYPFCNHRKVCELETFVNYIEKYSLKDWEKECGLELKNKSR
ncbi:lysosomal acid phosphatase-like protein 3 [Leptotrombidium deliense]|uniref:Lysosomal acid phosphatase-like protein 3 n=1 Tax=Leptotrombidium deliense TaxID=299467 RepID=A0A443SJU7_9ACAR|nr:lysosomal acid phosphatase-like protein 3 [Leptotrombidium deliense]